MNTFNKMGLYLSSFAPLFLLLLIKELIEILNQNWSFNFLNTAMLLLLFAFLIIGICTFLIIVKKINGNRLNKTIKIISKSNITDQHFLGYFSLFVLFAVSFEIEMYSMACVFFVVLLLIGIVYIKNDMYYINPLINILGYSFYDVEYIDQTGKIKKTWVFFKGKLSVDHTYIIKDQYSNFIFLKHK